ncbi:MAG: hypothetical protein IJF15_00945 [Oscillospiraceae bacterium]|nr:hypothetical protein [Oscillospiraceae bacterium]
MVKGISRRVIVVDSPDPRIFEQAIFIVRNDVLGGDGVTSRQLVDEARRVAKNYVRVHTSKPASRLPCAPLFWSAVGAFALGCVWLTVFLL